MKLKTTFKFYLVPNMMPYFGAYEVNSLNEQEPKIFLNMDATIEGVMDEKEGEKAELFHDLILQSSVHEFAHAMQEWLGKTYSENEVEKICASYKKEWGEVEQVQENESRGSMIRSYDLLDWLEELPSGADVKAEIFKMLNAENNWRIAYKERLGEDKK